MATRRPRTGSRTTESAEPLEASPRRRAPRAKAAAPVAAAGAQSAAAPASITVSDEARRAMIAQAAYLRAERRGFAPGGEVADWLAAEGEVDALLKAGHSGPPQ